MKKVLLVLFAIIIGMNLNTQAQDFSVVNNGVTIYYNITSSTSPYTVSVTYRGSSYSSYSNEYSGVVVIPDSVLYNGNNYKVTSIGDEAFYDCYGLTSIIIPSSVTSIGQQAFENCTGLYSITIPTSVEIINSNAFNNTLYYNNLPNGVVYINNVLYKYKGTMPANTTINIQAGTVSISNGAFYGCIGLTSIIIPNSITSIGSIAFYGCSGLTSITIPNSVTSIGDYTFYGCTGLTSITIPNSVTSIGTSAFSDCSGLTSLTIGNSVTSIGYDAFYRCSGLTSINIPNSVISIGDGAFYGCTGLTSITIPNSVTSIGDYTFYGCTGLTSIIFPSSITSIGDDAFASCRWLTSIICAALIPPIIWSNTFKSVEKTIPVYIPIGTKSAYQAAPYWPMFANFIEQEISIPTSIFQEREFKLYPNPTSNKAILEVEGLKSAADVLVLDLLGRVIKSYKINPTNNELEIDVNGFAKGVYNIRIMNDSINQTKKLIVQ